MAYTRRDFIRTVGLGVAAAPLTAAFTPVLTGDRETVKELLQRKTPNTWLFTGDSITHGAKHTHGCRSYPEVFAERIRWELARVRDVVINTGISGNTTQHILNDFEWRVARYSPSAVSLMIGTNDCAKPELPPAVFRKNLEQLVKKIRETGAVPLLHTPNIIIVTGAPERRRLPEYIPVIREVAAAEGVLLIDHYKYWESRPQETVFKNWLNDPLHPNAEGHREMARLLFRELEIFDASAPTCGAPYYEGAH
ncbi:SGNH/GDSL hydrolase family protein [Chitinophaga sp.]|uniref:SGNH/GDSL hydrolase family protein n=1 Tax=Chitinophaga sp. TaxID=1869181 RepID=UPI0031D05DE7